MQPSTTANVVDFPEVVKLTGLVNSHTHCRDTDAEKDGRAELHIPNLALVYEHVISIGNTAVPLTTLELVRSKLAQWRRIIPPWSPLKIHAAGLMTENTDPAEVLAGYDKPDGQEDWLVMKMFLKSVSNDGGKSVDDVRKIIPALKAMTYGPFKYKKRPMALMVHAERKYRSDGSRIYFLDREDVAVDQDIRLLLQEVPDAHIAICHISSSYTINQIHEWRRQGHNVSGEICWQYASCTTDDLFEDGNGGTAFSAHKFCVPIFKTPEDQEAVDEAMRSGLPYFHCGNDDACHLDDMTQDKGVKITRTGLIIPGQTQIAEAVVSAILERFMETRTPLEHAVRFLCTNARENLGLPPPSGIVTVFRREDWIVPKTIERMTLDRGNIKAHVAMGGQTRKYRVVRPAI